VVGVVLLSVVLCVCIPGCASKPSSGIYHTVKSGENLYRIGRRYGVDHDYLRRVNKISDATRLSVGTRLWVPRAGKGGKATQHASRKATKQAQADARKRASKEARREARLDFKWPLQGRLTSSFGMRRGRPHEGIDVAAPRGSSVRASESGKVIYSGRLGAYGRCVIVKHAGNYRSVYAHATKTLVKKGQFVDRGQKIATVGSTGRATGPHLHFEIRRSESPRDPMLYLPQLVSSR
jgi:murein DD-endopeptidase MepM/ murein hydrolase activator NlpD